MASVFDTQHVSKRVPDIPDFAQMINLLDQFNRCYDVPNIASKFMELSKNGNHYATLLFMRVYKSCDHRCIRVSKHFSSKIQSYYKTVDDYKNEEYNTWKTFLENKFIEYPEFRNEELYYDCGRKFDWNKFKYTPDFIEKMFLLYIMSLQNITIYDPKECSQDHVFSVFYIIERFIDLYTNTDEVLNIICKDWFQNEYESSTHNSTHISDLIRVNHLHVIKETISYRKYWIWDGRMSSLPVYNANHPLQIYQNIVADSTSLLTAWSILADKGDFVSQIMLKEYTEALEKAKIVNEDVTITVKEIELISSDINDLAEVGIMTTFRGNYKYNQYDCRRTKLGFNFGLIRGSPLRIKSIDGSKIICEYIEKCIKREQITRSDDNIYYIGEVEDFPVERPE